MLKVVIDRISDHEGSVIKKKEHVEFSGFMNERCVHACGANSIFATSAVEVVRGQEYE